MNVDYNRRVYIIGDKKAGSSEKTLTFSGGSRFESVPENRLNNLSFW
jgi:hypothetical protein